MINNDIEEITKDYLQALIDNEVIEHKTLEYKRDLPGNSDNEKKEFLADVTSFANASGGDLILGINQDNETGLPKNLQGINITNIDEEKTRLDNIVRTGIQPRLPSVNIKEVPLENSEYAIVIRIQKSWISPHRVILGGHDKFYSRNSSGKYPLDVGELRNAFNLSETITERIRNFRIDRIAKILADETPVQLDDNPKIVLHLIPISALNLAKSYDIRKIASNASYRNYLEPISGSWNFFRINLDGFITHLGGGNEKLISYSYMQFFRNGIIEAADAHYITKVREKPIIYVHYESALIKSLTKYLSFYKLLDVEMPVVLFLELLGVKGYTMGEKDIYDTYDRFTIDMNNIILPEVLIENYDEKAEMILKSSFDSIWNACGIPGSINYNENEEWAPR